MGECFFFVGESECQPELSGLVLELSRFILELSCLILAQDIHGTDSHIGMIEHFLRPTGSRQVTLHQNIISSLVLIVFNGFKAPRAAL